MTTPHQSLSLLLCLALVSACTPQQTFDNRFVSEAQVTDQTRAGKLLEKLPMPKNKLAVAVYDFTDETGQFKYNGTFTDYSSAVTKGGHAVLTKALLDAGKHKWFTVIERYGMKDLLTERQVISTMRGQYQPAGAPKLPDLPPLLYGGMLLEGGIVSYDSNIITGGAGAMYLGIGATMQYHRDVVTVYLRAVNVQTGEVVLSVTSSKTIFSTSLDSNLLKYVTFDRLLEAEAGFSVNEPAQLGVRQAIETSVYSLIMEGAIEGLWEFNDPVAGQKAINDYLLRKNGKMPREGSPEANIANHAAAQDPAPAPVAAVDTAPVAPVVTKAAPAPVAAVAPAPVPVSVAAQAVQQPAAVAHAAPADTVPAAIVATYDDNAQPVMHDLPDGRYASRYKNP